MQRLLRWTGILFAILFILVAIGAGIVYASSERVLNRIYPVPKISLTLPSDRLMKEGVGLGDRQLKKMTPAARDHFAFFDDGEVRALHAYLHGLGAARK